MELQKTIKFKVGEIVMRYNFNYYKDEVILNEK
jgi:hypothetical protein